MPDSTSRRAAGHRGRRSAAAIFIAAIAVPLTAHAAEPVQQPAALPKDAPHYLRYSYPAALAVPVPQHMRAAGRAAGPQTATLEQSQTYPNAAGHMGVWQSMGAVVPANNAFFQSLGSNGRSCFSCHQPADGLSINTGTLQQLFSTTAGQDPVFAPVDAANCPSSVPRDDTLGAAVARTAQGQRNTTAALRAAYSLLLDKGLFRVFLPVPRNAEFTVTVVSDPYGCNTNPTYAQQVDPVTQQKQQMVSVYRRPRMSANLKYAVTPALTLGGGGLPNIDFVTGQPVTDPKTGLPVSGNIMWDGREATLEGQAIAATLGHAQALRPPTAAQVAEIVSFEMGVYAAQAYDTWGGVLTANQRDGRTAHGGPQPLAEGQVSFGNFALYDAWPSGPLLAPTDPTVRVPPERAMRASIARGQALFNFMPISVNNVAGFNNAVFLGVTNPAVTTCASCHGNMPAGYDPFPAGQRDIGVGGQALALGGPAPAQDLPIFKLRCNRRAVAGYYGHEVLTNDPGLALISGRCADIGRRSVPQLRALAARAPLFSDGSAANAEDVVKFYNQRFKMGMSAGDIKDMANFLQAL